jgi:hypothetical protein
MKIGVVGAGVVGSSAAYAIVLLGAASESFLLTSALSMVYLALRRPEGRLEGRDGGKPVFFRILLKQVLGAIDDGV